MTSESGGGLGDPIESAHSPKAMFTVTNVLTGTATKYLLLGINIVVGVLLLPFTIAHLGKADYGLWMLTASLTSYLQLLDLGYGSGLVRHVSSADARGDVELVNRVLSTFAVVFAALGVVALVAIAILVTVVIPRFPQFTPDQVAKSQIVLAILGARIAVGLPLSVFGAATSARQRFALNNSVAMVVTLLTALLTYLVLSAGYGLVTLVAATASVNVLSYAAYAWTAKIAMPELRLRLRLFSPSLVREVTAFSVYLFIIGIAATVWYNLDNLVIGAALGTSAVAIYAVAFRLADYQRQLCSQFNGLLFPVVVRLEANRRPAALGEMLVESTRIAVTLIAIATIGVIGFGEPLIARWVGPGFEGASAPLYVLAAAGLIMVGLGPLGVFLLGTGQHRLVAFAAIAEAVSHLALSLLLVRPLGLLGVAIATAIPVTMVHLLILVPTACRQAQLPVASFALMATRPALFGSVPAILAIVALRVAAPPESVLAIAAQSLVVGAIYVVVVWLFGFHRDVRERYAMHVRDAVRRTTLSARLAKAV